MRRRRLATFGIGATAGAAACVLLTTNLTGPAFVGAVDRLGQLTGPPAAATDELPAFAGCEQLRDWYVDAALPQVGPWGWGGDLLPLPVPQTLSGTAVRDYAAGAPGVVPPAGARGVVPPPGGDNVTEVVGNGETGTNVQEVGVDEPDHAKTDGRILLRVRNGGLQVFDVTGDRARLLSRIDLPGGRVDVQELVLVGDTALVLGQRADWGYAWQGGFDTMPGRIASLPGSSGVTTLTQVDLTTPGAPTLVSHQRIDGDLVAAREYGDGTVRVVVTTGLPPLDFVQPNRDRTPRQAERENRAIVQATTASDWLPGVRRDGGPKESLLACDDVRHPEEQSGFGTISVLTFPIDDPAAAQTTGITAAGELVYSSTDRLYVATVGRSWWDVMPLDDGDAWSRGGSRPPHTSVHAFSLDAGRTTYTASGTVRGTVEDRWSFDEHEGRLRVASALGADWSPRENAVSVLEERDGVLVTVGSVDGLGPRERIQSVRWFGDLAVVVTFRETDPLYTVDLSEPSRPRVVGELKIPGFSAYLHPLGGDRLLGLGQDATRRGASLGAQVSTFDVRDLADVVRTDTLGFGPDTEMPVGWEARAFTFLPQRRVALVPYESWDTSRVVLAAVQVGLDGSLEVRRTWQLGRGSAGVVRTLPLDDGRVALVDEDVRIVDLR